ncbi:cell wall metabolism sensor histidine kinase WalK [Agrilactobacillus fermenti]|uniref:cell wall metabolism sensor histidine kinase WalK n=1 Tax=Agrilactobacillus fermenti TaxID=2586909 RepID=UPI001E324929|nr:cell wall metabolism sensor histidine kinase WalK [Agrilactobacillus fermenti]MCD2255614.1 cell wall metabolism sensor histidine kinase WalK [Agrilactobacillus fermenti]
MNKKINFFQSIHFKIAMAFVLLLLITLEIIGAFFIKSLERQNIRDFEDSIQIQPYVDNQLATELLKSNESESNKNIKNIITSDINNSSITELQVVDNKGVIRGTTNVNNQAIVGHRTTSTQVKQVLYNGRKQTRISYDNNQGSYYISILPLINPNSENNATVGAIYIRASMEKVYRDINTITVIFLTASLVAGLLGTLIAIFISRAITRPIDEMKKQAIRMARGDYSGQVRVYGQDELGQLAVAVNNLSVRVEEAQEASEAERRRLDSVLTNMTDGVIATDRRGNISILNDMAEEFIGMESKDAIGRSILQVLGIENEYSFRDLLEDNQQSMMLDFSDRSDHDLILHTTFSLIQRETGFVSGLVCVLHDVTEQQKIDQERREFVSNVSHELRTPLTSMRSYIEALNDGAWQDPKVAPEFLKVTQEETDRMIRMVTDLLSLSRMDQGTAKMETEFVNINEFFNYILDRFDMMLKNDKTDATLTLKPQEEKNYKIKREFTNRDLWVEIDTDKMTQVLDNIMNNAIKYSPDGGTITCRLIEMHNNVIISISDQGLGIPRKDLNKIFDRFYRVDKARSRKQGGTGLGLAISKEVIEAHHGRIWADSVEGKGSTFYISLPYHDYEESEDEWG